MNTLEMNIREYTFVTDIQLVLAKYLASHETSWKKYAKNTTQKEITIDLIRHAKLLLEVGKATIFELRFLTYCYFMDLNHKQLVKIALETYS